MPRLYLIRHALAAPRDPEDRDPPLGHEGIHQAQAMAEAFSPPEPLPIFTSPLMRCRMTAAPLAARWGIAADVLEPIREVPAPGSEGAARARFLDRLLLERWPAVLAREGPMLHRWYDALIAALRQIRTDSVIVSHYVAINVIVGLATGSDKVSSFRPGHASVTVLDLRDGDFALVRLGQEAPTKLTSG